MAREGASHACEREGDGSRRRRVGAGDGRVRHFTGCVGFTEWEEGFRSSTGEEDETGDGGLREVGEIAGEGKICRDR